MRIFLNIILVALFMFASCKDDTNNIVVPKVEAQPVIRLDSASSITSNSAILNGSINPNGLLTRYYFEYGPTLEYGFSTPIDSIKSDTTLINVCSPITTLLPGSLYHWRIVAINNGGTYYSNDSTFNTFVDYFPLLVGQLWSYSYSGFYNHPGDINSYNDKGTKILEIISSITKGDTVEYICSVLTNITRLFWRRGDSTVIKDSVTYFSIHQVNNFIIMPDFAQYLSERKFSRYYPSTTPDKIDLGVYYYSDRFILTKGKGLSEYYFYSGGNHSWGLTYLLQE